MNYSEHRKKRSRKLHACIDCWDRPRNSGLNYFGPAEKPDYYKCHKCHRIRYNPSMAQSMMDGLL